MSLRVQNPLLSARIKGLAEIRDTRYPLDLTLRGQQTLLDSMSELESRHGRYSQESSDALLASLARFEPTESELEEMYATRDMEDMLDCGVSMRNY